jgi:hypothetical protein
MAARKDQGTDTLTLGIPEVGKPVKVPVKVHVSASPESAKHRYWCGIRRECDIRSYIGVAGIVFNKITDPARVSSDGTQTFRNQYLGCIETLTDEDVAKIQRAVADKVVRGKFIVNLDNAHQNQQPGDIPLARYLYMVSLPDDPKQMPSRDINGECPEAMAQES